MKARLKLATRVELDRICTHLGIEKGTDKDTVEAEYLEAADNTIYRAVRKYISNDAPTYFKTLVLIYKQLRSYSEAFREKWDILKANFGSKEYELLLQDMDESELEDRILAIYREKFERTEKKVESGQISIDTITRYIPGIGSTGAGVLATGSSIIAARAPFAALGPSALVGPVGIALGVIAISSTLSGPAYRKIIPATVEIMLIGKRLEFMPKD